MFLKYLFIGTGLLLAGMLTVYESYLLMKKEGRKNHPVYVSVMAGLLLLYVICALCLIFFVKGYLNKFIMLLFALSPFAIGKLAIYEKRTLFCFIQVFCIILSVLFLLVV